MNVSKKVRWRFEAQCHRTKLPRTMLPIKSNRLRVR
jgi:hypothetical protein